MDNKELEIAKEIEQIALEHNISVQELIEEYKKTHNSTDQSKSYEHNKIVNEIISPRTDIDNGEVYNIKTGETIRSLEEI